MGAICAGPCSMEPNAWIRPGCDMMMSAALATSTTTTIATRIHTGVRDTDDAWLTMRSPFSALSMRADCLAGGHSSATDGRHLLRAMQGGADRIQHSWLDQQYERGRGQKDERSC